MNIGGPELREALSKAPPSSSKGAPRLSPKLFEGGEVLPGRPKNSEVNDPSSQFVESKAKKKKFQGTPVEAIPEDSANSPKLIDGCAVFRASFRWVLRLKEWFTQGLDTFQRCTLREPATVPEPWTERLERLNTRSFTEAQEDLLREAQLVVRCA